MIVFDPSQHSPEKCQGMLSSVIVPRPIAMISTVNADGVVNLAPYSYFMPVTGDPPLIAVTMGTRRASREEPKDTWANTERSGEFVVNVATRAMRDVIEAAAMDFPAEVSEIEELGLSTFESQVVAPPSLRESLVHLECRVHQVVPLGREGVYWSTVNLVIAEVVCMTLDDAVCTDDHRIDVDALGAVGRMTFPHFVQAGDGALFSLERFSYEEHLATGRLPGPIG